VGSNARPRQALARPLSVPAPMLPTVRLGPYAMNLAEAAAAAAVTSAQVGEWPPAAAAVAQPPPPQYHQQCMPQHASWPPQIALAPAAAAAALAAAPARAGGAVQPSPGSSVVRIRQQPTAGAAGVQRAAGASTRTLWTETPANIAALHSAPSSVTESPAGQMLAVAAADPNVMWHPGQGRWVSGESGNSRQRTGVARLDFGQGPAQ
jgi:hypothetical protein